MRLIDADELIEHAWRDKLDPIGKIDWCPNCGAKMQRVNTDEDND